MCTIINLLNRKEINLSLYDYGKNDCSIGWEIKTIVDHPELFNSFYKYYPLKTIVSLDDYCLYLLSVKFTKMQEYVSILAQEEHKTMILDLSSQASKELKKCNIGSVIAFINSNIDVLMSEQYSSFDLNLATLEIIYKHANGIKSATIEKLLRNHPEIIVSNFDKFYKIIDIDHSLFTLLFPNGELDTISKFGVKKSLDIWLHYINKKNSPIKGIIDGYILTLFNNLTDLSKTITIDNVLELTNTVNVFSAFLKKIKNPLSSQFETTVKNIKSLLKERLKTQGLKIEYRIPAREVVKMWKETKGKKLIVLTHKCKNTIVLSKLSDIEAEMSISDSVATVVPNDNYYSPSLQRKLSVYSAINSAIFLDLIYDNDARNEFLRLMKQEIRNISERIVPAEDSFNQDIEYWSSTIKLFTSIDRNNAFYVPMCYSLSMFTCALLEKILRGFFLSEKKSDTFIKSNQVLLGNLLNKNNDFMTSAFGEKHLKHLSYYLIKDTESNIGLNIRNALAHWHDINIEQLNCALVGEVIWLFTDVINSITIYYLTKEQDKNQ